MDAHHRKIDLQSPSDLTYLLDNIKVAAQQKLDLAIPLSAAPEGEDAYRRRVEELVHEYILRTLTLALPSLALNGLDPSPTLLRANPSPKAATSDDNGCYEAYDPRLAEKLRTLYAEFDTQSTRVAELRREAPGAAAREYMKRLEAELVAEQDFESQRETKSAVMKLDDLDMGILERRAELERTWDRGAEGLMDLGKIPGVMAKLDRAEKAVGVVQDNIRK